MVVSLHWFQEPAVMGTIAIQALCSGLGGLVVPLSRPPGKKASSGHSLWVHLPLPGSTDLLQPAQWGPDTSSAETSESALEKCSCLGQDTCSRYELICSKGPQAIWIFFQWNMKKWGLFFFPQIIVYFILKLIQLKIHKTVSFQNLQSTLRAAVFPMQQCHRSQGVGGLVKLFSIMDIFQLAQDKTLCLHLTCTSCLAVAFLSPLTAWVQVSKA